LNTFADDTKVFKVVEKDADRQRLQDDIKALEIWSCKWQMEFNAAKCKVMHVGRTNPKFQYEMNCQALESTVQEKDLGVIITDSLKSSSNCHAAYKKANRVLGMIRRTISYKSADILLPLYKTLVRPLVEYCTPAWSPHYVKDKTLLEKVQHRFTRMIPRLKQLEYSTRLDALNLWTLEERRNRADLIEMFKMVRGLSGVNADILFERARDTRARGHPLKLRKHHCHTDLRKFFFSERVVSRWNSLDEECVLVQTVNSFKSNLKRIRKLQRSFFTDT
jgi:hypothetical protein